MADECGLLRLGPDHDPGRVAQEQQRHVERVAELHESGGLVGAIRFDRAGLVHRVVGDHADRLGPRPGSVDVIIPGREPRAQLEHRVGVGETRDRPRGCRRSGSVVPGRPRRSRLWSATRPSGPARSEVGQELLGHGDRLRLRPTTATSTTPLATCTSSGPISSGATIPSPPPSIIAGPPMPMFEPSVAITTSQHPRMAALPAKHRPLVIPDPRCDTAQRPQRWNAMTSRPETPGASVSPGRPPPPSAKNTVGQPLPFDHLEQPVLLAMVLHALRAGENHVVVGQHGGRAVRRRSRPRSPDRPPGVWAISSSTARRRRCAAITSGPYSMNEPASHRSSTFSRAVRWPRP